MKGDLAHKARGRRLASFRKRAGWRSARSFAIDHGMKESSYSAHENGWRTIGVDDAEKYAKYLRLAGLSISASDILFHEDDPTTGDVSPHAPPDGTSIPVRGIVAAGSWLETDSGDIERFEPIPFPPDTRWPKDAQFGLVVRGTSVNNFATEGDVLICVSLADTGLQIVDEDLVIVERVMQQGGLREMTAKRARFRNGSIELWPDSSDPKFQKPLVINRKYETEDDGVRIIARVEWAFKSSRKR